MALRPGGYGSNGLAVDPTDPNQDPYDLSNPTPGNRGSGAPTSSPTGLRPGSYGSNGPITQTPDEAPAPTTPGSTPYPAYNPDPAAQTSGRIVDPYANTRPAPTQTSTGTTTSGSIFDDPAVAGKFDDSFNNYASDPTVSNIKFWLAQGLTGDQLVNSIKSVHPDAKVSWDAVRGNVDLDLGGGHGLQIDQNAQGQWGVHPYDDGEGAPGGGGGGTGGGAGGAGGGTGGADLQGLLAQMLAGQDVGRQGQFFDQLQGYIDQYGRPVTPDDPIIKAQTDAFRAAQTRGAQQGQAAQAEANAYKGVPTGTQDAATAGGYEAAALNTGNFQANQMFQEQTQRRNALQNILSLYGGQLTAEQSRQLQAEIAAINATLSNQQMINQSGQFYDQLGADTGYREAMLNAQLVNQMGG